MRHQGGQVDRRRAGRLVVRAQQAEQAPADNVQHAKHARAADAGCAREAGGVGACIGVRPEWVGCLA